MNKNNTKNNFEAKNTADKDGFQESIMTKITELGDLLERAGEKIEANGFKTIGEAVYKLGDKIEHFQGGQKKTGLKTEVDKSQNIDRKSV